MGDRCYICNGTGRRTIYQGNHKTNIACPSCEGVGVISKETEPSMDCLRLEYYDLKQAIFDLYLWQYDAKADHFTVQLYSLMNKADPCNFKRLTKAYPVESMAYQMWEHCDEPKKFFKSILGDNIK